MTKIRMEDLTPDLYRIMPKDSPIFGTTTTAQTATEFVAKQKISDQIIKDFTKMIDAEIFKLMTGGSIPPTQYDMLFAATVVCVDCGQPYLKRTPRDLLATHCSSCEDAQKEAAGLK